MAIEGIPGRVNTGEIEPVAERSRVVGPGATPALQSSSGLTGRPMPPDSIRRRPTLAELFRQEDGRGRKNRQTLAEGSGGSDIGKGKGKGKGIVSRALEGQDLTGTPPSSPGPNTSTSRRPSAPASRAAARPFASEASGGTAEPAVPGPRLTRSLHGRHRADSAVQAIADQWQIENSRRSHLAGSSAASAPADVANGLAATSPGVARSPTGRLGAENILRAMTGRVPAGARPAIREEHKVRFAGAELRMFDPDDQRKALKDPVRFPIPSDAVVAARGKSLARSASEAAHANMAANGADEKAQKRYVTQLGVAVGRLQSLAIESPERVQQAIQRDLLPAEVLGDKLDPQFVEDVLDLHAQFHEWQAAAPALAQTDFSDAGGVATIIVNARQDFAQRARNQAALLALMAETGEA